VNVLSVDNEAIADDDAWSGESEMAAKALDAGNKDDGRED